MKYMEASTPKSEPAYITTLRKEAYTNGLNAGSLLFIAPAVSQATACDGTRITTTTIGQEVAPGTLPIYCNTRNWLNFPIRCMYLYSYSTFVN